MTGRRPMHWLDRAVGVISPSRGLDRHRARQKLLTAAGARAEYEGASFGRRTAGWRRSGRDANSELNAATMVALRGVARELVRNNPFAARAVAAIASNMVGAGITFQVYRNGKVDLELTKLARLHFDSTACDAAGSHNLYGLQLQAARTIVTSGSVLMRRRWRRASDGLPVPFQLQVLEPDYINMQLSAPTENGGQRLQGIQLDAIGRRVGYWMYSGHPGSLMPGALEAALIPATEIAHAFRTNRPEDQHGETWFAPVIVRMKDFGDYEDAQLVRQKIAACFSVFRIGSDEQGPDPTTDSNGNPFDDDNELLTNVEPGIIEDLAPGTSIEFASPPGVDGYEPYSRISLQAIMAGLGIPYETGTGDLSKVSFISGRLGRLQCKRDNETWQWSMFIPQFCEPAGKWFLEAAQANGVDVAGASFQWTPPRFEEMSPETAIPATRDAIRSGQQTISGAAKERGEDPDVFLDKWAADAKALDDRGLIFDSDPRHVTAVGNPVAPPVSETISAMDKRG